MQKTALSPSWGYYFSLPDSKRGAHFSGPGLQPYCKEKQVGPRKSRLGTSGIYLCQSKAIIGPRFREQKEITYLQKHLSNQYAFVLCICGTVAVGSLGLLPAYFSSPFSGPWLKLGAEPHLWTLSLPKAINN